MEELPLEVQTLYAELMEQLTALEAHRSIGSVPGCMTTKAIKGETYYYFQYSDPRGIQRQVYIGKRGPVLDRVVEQYQSESRLFKKDAAQIHRLCALLRTGGAFVTDSASARVLKSLAESGVFRLEGVLIGTQAFGILGNLLGVQWEKSALKTHDIDIAGEPRMTIAVPDIRVDVPKVLEGLQMGFLPVPPLNPRNPSTSFKIRGKPLRVDLLTPARKKHGDDPIFIPRFNASAQSVRFLDYLLKKPERAAVVNGGGVLLNVPSPARFAFHKVVVARERDLAMHDKTGKDLIQACQILSMMTKERPGDLMVAWDEMTEHGAEWSQRFSKGLAVMSKLDPTVCRELKNLLNI